jgi:hypothetical protein
MKKQNIFPLIFVFCITAISFIFNILCFVDYLNQPTYTLGKLKTDININGFYNDSKDAVIFSIPRGTIVTDVSPQFIAAAGVFDVHRVGLTILISPDLVDYTKLDDTNLYLGTVRSQRK